MIQIASCEPALGTRKIETSFSKIGCLVSYKNDINLKLGSSSSRNNIRKQHLPVFLPVSVFSIQQILDTFKDIFVSKICLYPK